MAVTFRAGVALSEGSDFFRASRFTGWPFIDVELPLTGVIMNLYVIQSCRPCQRNMRDESKKGWNYTCVTPMWPCGR